MDSKTLAIIMGVVIIAAGTACVGVYLLNNDDDPIDELIRKSDYTLLDSTDNIKVGMVVESILSGDSSGKIVTNVIDVADGKVTYKSTGDATEVGRSKVGVFPEYGYSKLQKLIEEAAQSEGKFTVTVEGLEYTLAGELGKEQYVETYDLTVTLDRNEEGGIPASIEGSVTITQEKLTIKNEYSTADGFVTTKMIAKGEETITVLVSDFYVQVTNNYDSLGPETPVRFGNVDAVSSTWTVEDGDTTNIGYAGRCLKEESHRYGITHIEVTGIYLG